VAMEIERKFLVKDDSWRAEATAERMRQGYLCSVEDRAVRARIIGDRAFLTIKGAKNGISRFEYEYEIPPEDAAEILDRLCERPLIEKTRHRLTVNGLEWVVDVFEGDNAGLVVAEVELEDEAQTIEMPAWAGEEVTDDPRYLNVNLAKRPYRLWTADERTRPAGP
jgi:adenylate cyclase